MKSNDNCMTFIDVYRKDGDSFEKILKNLINSGHLIINDVKYNQQIVIKTEKSGGI